MHIFTEFRVNKSVKYRIVFPNENDFLYSSLSFCQPEYRIPWFFTDFVKSLIDFPGFFWNSLTFLTQKKILTSLYFH